MDKTKKLTNEMLDEIYQKLLEGAAEPSYDKEGKPTYSLGFYGTEEEIKEIKRKLSEINPPST